MTKIEEIKEAISALETTAEGQLKGGFAVISRVDDFSSLSNVDCGCTTNADCDCGCK